MSEDQPMTQEQIDRWERRMFGKLRKEVRVALDSALANPDGMARLLAISDEEWQQAVDTDNGA